ncbi:FlgO family outer membrane protein [Endothiovibrio diazotrophicus]
MNHKITRFSALLLIALLAVGCTATTTATREKSHPDSRLTTAFYKASEQLIANLNSSLDPAKPLIAASFVSVDSLEQSSSLGRMATEQVTSRLVQMGFHVVETKLRDNIYMAREQGEFLLSRELRNISNQHDAQGVLVGTYAVGADTVFMTVRLIRAADSKIIASHDFSLPIDNDVKELLSERRAVNRSSRFYR